MRKKILATCFGTFIFVYLNFLANNPVQAQTCTSQNIDPGESTTVIVRGAQLNAEIAVKVTCPQGETCTGGNWHNNYIHFCAKADGNGNASIPIGPFTVNGTYQIQTYYKWPGICQTGPASVLICDTSFSAGESSEGSVFMLQKCDGGYMTALGCIPTDESDAFVAWLLKTAIGLGGGFAVLLIIFGGFLIILSSGDPQRLQTGKEILTSAIIGLLIIIFSVFLLRIIGVEILKIPGFE